MQQSTFNKQNRQDNRNCKTPLMRRILIEAHWYSKFNWWGYANQKQD